MRGRFSKKKPFDELWQFMTTNGNFLLLMATYGNSWVLVNITRYHFFENFHQKNNHHHHKLSSDL